MEENDAGGIRCSEVLAMLSELVDGDLPAAERSRIAAHAAECPSCARFGASFTSLVRSLGTPAAEEAIAPETWQSVMRALSREPG